LLVLKKEAERYMANVVKKRSSLGLIDEQFAEVHFALALKKNSRMNEVINRKIGQMLQSGIIQNMEKIQFSSTKKLAALIKDEEASQEDAEQLTIEHLELCFLAIMIGLVLSCFAFAIELLVGFISSF
jgi:hypothetical protein